MPSLTLCIAEHPVELSIPSRELFQEASRRYEGFLSPLAPRTRFLISFPGSLQGVVDAGVPHAVHGRGQIRFWRNDLEAVVSEDMAEARVAMRELTYTLDAVLRIFYSILLIRSGGLLLHAASVGLDGVGVAFVGPTESGKSDVCRLGHGGIHLTDELSPVKASGNGFTVFGSPFWGLFERGGANVGVPLAAVLLLHRGATRIQPVPLPSAVQGVCRCVVNFSREPHVASQIMTTVVRLVTSVPTAALWSPPDDSLWPLVRRLLNPQVP